MLVATVKSVQEVVTNIRRRENAFARAVSVGLKMAGIYIQRESQKIVPVDTGNLRAGAFTRAEGSGFGTRVTVGYVAEYAMFVHEDLTKAHGAEYNAKYAHLMKGSELLKRRDSKTGRFQKSVKPMKLRGENQQAKFLEDVIVNQSRQISAIFRDYVAKQGFQ